MALDQVWVLCVVFGALVLLVTEWLPTGITGVLILVSLILGDTFLSGGIPGSESVFAGLTSSAVIAVAAMFVISAGIARTGAVGFFANAMTGASGSDPRRVYVGVLLLVMVASAFMNNTPLVLIFMPIVIGLAGRMDQPPSRFLIPLSFVSIMGGMCTLVGTSTNLVVASSLAQVSGSGDDAPIRLGMFDFLPAGIILAVAGAAYLAIFGRRLLPLRTSLGLATDKGIATEYMTELEIRSNSSYVGTRLGEVFGDGGGDGPRILQLIRNDVIQPPLPDTVLKANDLLLIKGDPATIVRFHNRGDTGVIPAVNIQSDPQSQPRTVAMTLAEVVLAPGSRWVDRRVRDVHFRERYSVSVFAVQRHGEHLREKVDELRLKTGDILLIQGTPESLQNLKTSDNLLVIEGVQESIPHTRRAPMALVAMLVFIGLVIAFPDKVHVAAVVAAVTMVVGRCLSAGEAYSAFNWDILFLLGGTLALGAAFAECGLATKVGQGLVNVCGPMGIHAMVGGLFLFSMLLTQVMSNNAAAAMLTPLAYSTGMSFPGEYGPMPFVMAVAFGASCSFLTPIGYQTNLIIYGPGGYKFTDFMKIGLPLSLIFLAIATAVLPMFY